MSLLLSTLIKCSISLWHFQQQGTGQHGHPSRGTPVASLHGADNPHPVCSQQLPPFQTRYHGQQETAGTSAQMGRSHHVQRPSVSQQALAPVSLLFLVWSLGHEYEWGGCNVHGQSQRPCCAELQVAELPNTVRVLGSPWPDPQCCTPAPLDGQETGASVIKCYLSMLRCQTLRSATRHLNSLSMQT